MVEVINKSDEKDVTAENLAKNIISIHYPGVVKNESKALETLGGIRTISSVSSIVITETFKISRD